MGRMPLTLFLVTAIVLAALYVRRIGGITPPKGQERPEGKAGGMSVPLPGPVPGMRVPLPGPETMREQVKRVTDAIRGVLERAREAGRRAAGG